MPAGDADTPLPTIGWREWVALPALGVAHVKAKIDTGARSSAIHAFDVEEFQREGQPWVRFNLHPEQRGDEPVVEAEAVVVDVRKVKSSGGQISVRPVIVTEVQLFGQRWPVELTLARRDAMGFRMLLGRQAIRDRFVVAPDRSYLAGRRKRKKKKH